jgi:hypothetical protein
VLAYLLWHRPGEGVERESYERAAERFHRSLHHAPPAGFRGSAVYRVSGLPWLEPAGPAEDPPAEGSTQAAEDCYEDWYLLDDFAAVGVLNEAAVAHGHRGAHDELARRFGAGAGGMYGLLEGRPDLTAAEIVWVSRPPGAEPALLGALLGDGMDPEHASLWRRQLVLGPAPEYCLLTPGQSEIDQPAGVAPTRLPDGWRASTSTREVLWTGD